ncbi:MAG: toprim domain-containing protein [Acidimicrobiaceae bacterium]|nr:toprim domain-containing protein [Acidimicrobiaceae bacterium]
MIPRQRLLDAHLAAASFYRQALESSRGPRHYLVARGAGEALDDRRWEIGYAPPGWTNLLTHLEASGFSHKEIHAAGLAVQTRRGALIDRFRERVMFGIHDENGELIGFIGRCPPALSTGGSAGVSGAAPKYLNSPATDLYTKGRELFGLAEQANALDHGATAALVEGPLDVLAVAQLASRSAVQVAAVSTCGTTVRPEQVDLLLGHSRGEVIVAYDGDDAGHKAARTAYERLSGRVDRVWAAPLPGGEDPGSLAISDPARLLKALGSRTPLADQLVDDLVGQCQLDNAEARVAALHHSTRVIAGFAPADVSRQVARIAARLGFPPDLVTEDLTAALSRKSSIAPPRAGVIHSRGRPAATAPGLTQ